MTKGVYVLIIAVSRNIRVTVGSLGIMDFECGLYAYVGSAQSSLEKRIERHLRKDKRKFWHIDYLLENGAVKVLKVFCGESGKSGECETVEKLSRIGIPIMGFGSSDCKCKSHLFRLVLR